MIDFQLRIDHFHHIVPGSADPRIDQLLARVGVLMTITTDLQAKLAQLLNDVAAETTLDQSIITLIQGDAAIIADLRKQLADAIAANNPEALQAVVDAMEGAHATMVANAKAAGDAVVANTGAGTTAGGTDTASTSATTGEAAPPAVETGAAATGAAGVV